ncbi:hypothetical protein C9I57_28480 [Trinickia symbiotica]|uniref:Transmembrane protein n=1 Tax=Trinickia symbiotica TaxID=863227 RepID=A0A2T3XL96_9BURK|nr:hypothetical protein [Trinickia symbiotica]PTB17300.1 hypothetical protein C9I57_28480 [Trinickia symbiotica]
MSDGGSTPADWKKLYDWYRQNTEALQEQVEAITDDLPKVRDECAALRESTESMTQTALLIQSHVRRAEDAWGKAEEVANSVGLTAASSATSAVAAAANDMVSSLGHATEHAWEVTAALKRTISFSRAISIAYFLLVFIVCLACSYLAYRKGVNDEAARHTEPTAERSATLMYYGAALEKMFQQGSAKDRQRLEQLYNRVTRSPP